MAAEYWKPLVLVDVEERNSKITVRNNLTLNAVDPAEAMFQTLTEWYEAATMECTVCYTKYSVKQDKFCNVCHNVLCAEVSIQMFGSQKKRAHSKEWPS